MAGAAATLPGALVLEVDPDLGRDIDPAERELARRVCRGELLHLPPGRWRASPQAARGENPVAFVIAGGVLVRELGLRECCMVEFLGRCDALLPPVRAQPPRLGTETRLTAVSDLVLVVLGQPFIRAAARWPTLLSTLQQRLEAQRESLAIQGLIAHLPTAKDRLLLMLWHLAGRWGHVTPEGIVLPWSLNHEILGRLIGARRPTVTIALRELSATAGIRRREDGSWLLPHSVERMINAITLRGTSHGVGERLELIQEISQPTGQSRALRAEATQIRSRRRGGHAAAG